MNLFRDRIVIKNLFKAIIDSKNGFYGLKVITIRMFCQVLKHNTEDVAGETCTRMRSILTKTATFFGTRSI